jgi:hypothetical protein
MENKKFTAEELQKIDKANDLHVSPFRADGVTYGTPTWIWSVVVDGEIYVRAYYGQKSKWYQSALEQKAGRIVAAGMTKEVTYEPVRGDFNEQVDEAYRKKYAGESYLASMTRGRAKKATMKISPK